MDERRHRRVPRDGEAADARTREPGAQANRMARPGQILAGRRLARQLDRHGVRAAERGRRVGTAGSADATVIRVG